jgi:hypothetical protein
MGGGSLIEGITYAVMGFSSLGFRIIEENPLTGSVLDFTYLK